MAVFIGVARIFAPQSYPKCWRPFLLVVLLTLTH